MKNRHNLDWENVRWRLGLVIGSNLMQMGLCLVALFCFIAGYSRLNGTSVLSHLTVFDIAGIIWLGIAAIFLVLLPRKFLSGAASGCAVLAGLYPMIFASMGNQFIPEEFRPAVILSESPLFWFRYAELSLAVVIFSQSWLIARKDRIGIPHWLPFAMGLASVVSTFEVWAYASNIDLRLAIEELEKNRSSIISEILSQLDRRKDFLETAIDICRRGKTLEKRCIDKVKPVTANSMGIGSLTYEPSKSEKSSFEWSFSGRFVIMTMQRGPIVLSAVWKTQALAQSILELPAHLRQIVTFQEAAEEDASGKLKAQGSIDIATQWAGNPLKMKVYGIHYLAPARKHGVVAVRVVGNLLFALVLFLLQRGAAKAAQLKDANIELANQISRRKQVEQELLASRELAQEASRAKSQFVAQISHEIRNPLQAIQTAAFLLGESQISPKQRRLLEAIDHSSLNVHEIVSDVLDISKIESGRFDLEMVDFSIRNLIKHLEEMFAPVATQKGLEFRIKIDKDVPKYIKGDTLRIRQILVNLVSNALKFTEEGHVSLNVYVVHAKKLRFEIRDTGPGLSRSASQKLFTPFAQGESNTARRYGGSGLGLSIAKHLVNLMDGSIAIQSELNVGTAVTVELPLREAKAPKLPETSTPDSKARFDGAVALVVDDDALNLSLITSLMESFGFTVHFANNGNRAVEIFKSTRFDIILMDKRMPEKDGPTAIKEIRQFNTDVPIILLSADATKQDQEEALRAGASRFVAKPVQPEALRQSLQELIALQDYSEKMETKNLSDLYPQLIAIFLKDSPSSLERLRNAAKEADWESIGFECHRMVSGAEHLQLKNISAALKDLARCRTTAKALRKIAILQKDFQRLMKAQKGKTLKRSAA